MERISSSYRRLPRWTQAITGIALASLGVATAHAQALSVSECERVGMSVLDPDASRVPPAIQELRTRMLDAGVNTLTFHNMDEIFSTRTVPRAGPVWELPSDTQPLDFAYEFAGEMLAAEAALEGTYTNALLILKDGRIVSEIYRNNTGPDTRFISFSMSKSITSMMIGLAIEEGVIESLDDAVVDYVPELERGAYRRATIRQIMEMRSGVDYPERYDFDNPGVAATNHVNSLVLNLTRFADIACIAREKTSPGAVFEYKTLDTAVLGWLLEHATGMTASAYLSSRIWEPLGAEADGYFILDGEPGVGREFTGAGFNATLRDYGRLGQMVLDGGVANGRRVLPAEWIAESTRPGYAETATGGYGLQWWTAPDSNAFYALGLQGQFIYIDPDTRTVTVKLSHFPPGDQTASRESLAFLRAVSAWQP